MKAFPTNKIVRIFFFIVVMFILTSISSAENCSVILRNECTGHVLMGLSDYINAHGELAEQGNYPYVLCCDFGEGNTTCNGNNKIIKLSAPTNAHAEVSGLNNYNFQVCYENLICTNRTTECDADEIGLISLSANTNAHIGGIGDYNYKICCKTTSICGNGIKESGEECDDGNLINGDGCSSFCIWENKNNEKKETTNKKDKKCYPNWECSDWGGCIDGLKKRSCVDLNNCEISFNKPNEILGCTKGFYSPLTALAISKQNLKNNKAFKNIIPWVLLVGIIFILIIIMFLLFRKKL